MIIIIDKNECDIVVHTSINPLPKGATGGGGGAPPPSFHVSTKEMSLNRGATHITLGLRPCIISAYLRPPPSKLPG